MPRKRLNESQKTLAGLVHKRDHFKGESAPSPDKRMIRLALVKKPRIRKPKEIGGHIVARYGGRKTKSKARRQK
jgi:hypothetical protein